MPRTLSTRPVSSIMSVCSTSVVSGVTLSRSLASSLMGREIHRSIRISNIAIIAPAPSIAITENLHMCCMSPTRASCRYM